jgi:hypothetical protein
MVLDRFDAHMREDVDDASAELIGQLLPGRAGRSRPGVTRADV